MILVYDSEGNGLREEITRVWCIAIQEFDSGAIYSYGPDRITEGLAHLASASKLVCHNQLNYDLPVFRKLYNWSPPVGCDVFDTYIASQLLWPDRPTPKGYKGKGGPHSVEAWGYRVGIWKPEHEDWSQYSEDMMHRCIEDTKIQSEIYKRLLKEMEE